MLFAEALRGNMKVKDQGGRGRVEIFVEELECRFDMRMCPVIGS